MTDYTSGAVITFDVSPKAISDEEWKEGIESLRLRPSEIMSVQAKRDNPDWGDQLDDIVKAARQTGKKVRMTVALV